jgi:hypothetical protein
LNFTYAAYEEMLSLLKDNCYQVCNYKDCQLSNRCVILRHDVDFSLEAALRFAELEYKNGVQSTYFILLSTGFYNPLHKKARDILKEIKVMGHEIGLHFDEANYVITNKEELICNVKKEINIMSQGLDMDIKTVSMHRPSQWVLETDAQFDTVINSYSKEFFNVFKYLSDSRMHWREDIYKVIQSNTYERLHILTHPIWYGTRELTMREKLKEFINAQKYRCYDNVRENIRDLNEVLLKAEL